MFRYSSMMSCVTMQLKFVQPVEVEKKIRISHSDTWMNWTTASNRTSKPERKKEGKRSHEQFICINISIVRSSYRCSPMFDRNTEKWPMKGHEQVKLKTWSEIKFQSNVRKQRQKWKTTQRKRSRKRERVWGKRREGKCGQQNYRKSPHKAKTEKKSFVDDTLQLLHDCIQSIQFSCYSVYSGTGIASSTKQTSTSGKILQNVNW